MENRFLAASWVTWEAESFLCSPSSFQAEGTQIPNIRLMDRLRGFNVRSLQHFSFLFQSLLDTQRSKGAVIEADLPEDRSSERSGSLKPKQPIKKHGKGGGKFCYSFFNKKKQFFHILHWSYAIIILKMQDFSKYFETRFGFLSSVIVSFTCAGG